MWQILRVAQGILPRWADTLNNELLPVLEAQNTHRLFIVGQILSQFYGAGQTTPVVMLDPGSSQNVISREEGKISMKRLMLIALMSSVAAFAAEDTNTMSPEMMKAFQEAGTPGPEHAMLNSLAGEWKVTTKSWQSEKANPEVSTGTSTFKPILGGRFVQQDFKGSMNNMPYEGTGVMGFNNITKKFESTWHDSMSTAMMSFEGTMNEKTKVIAETGEFMCPVKKEVQKIRSEMKIISQAKMTFTLWMPDMQNGKEYKGMEQTYTRVK